MQGFGNGSADECRALLGLFINLGESLKGHRPRDRRLVDSEPLAAKVVYHASSILYLFRGTRLDDIPETSIDFVDHASMSVVARALLESVWAFHSVFVDPKTEDEFTFRFSGWMLAGLVERQEFPALTDFGREQLEKDKQAIAYHRKELQATKAFARLSVRQRPKALNGQLWRPQSLRATATAFLGGRFSASLYSWLSGYQHGDALSVIQMRATDDYEKQRHMTESSLLLVAISLSQMIKAYLRLWPQLELVTNRYPKIQSLVEMYCRFPDFDPAADD